MIAASDGSNFTGTVTVYITKDSGSQTIGSVGSGICTHKGLGYHEYDPSQSETNADHIAFTFIGTGAVTNTIQVDTENPLFTNTIVFGTGVSGATPTVTISNSSSPAGAYADWAGSILVTEDTDDTLSLCVRQIVYQDESVLTLDSALTFTPTSNSRYWVLPGSNLELIVNDKLPLKNYLTGTNDPWGDIDGWSGSVSESEELDFGASDRTKLNAIYNKLPSKNYLTGTANSDGDIEIDDVTGLNRFPMAVGTVTSVDSQSAFSVSFAGTGDYDDSIRGCVLYIEDEDHTHFAIRTILHSYDSGGVPLVVVGSPVPFTVTTGLYVELLPPSGEDLWANNPMLIQDGVIASGTAGQTLVTMGTVLTAYEASNLRPGYVVKIKDISTEELLFCRLVSATTTTFTIDMPLPFTIEAGIDTYEIFGDPTLVGTPSYKTKLDEIHDKLPSANFLTGSQYSDGAIVVGDIGGLEDAVVAGVQTALDGSEIAFSVEALNTMRDHFYGGKLFIESTVDDSAVTPTTTSFAGGNELSNVNDFYSKTNAVLAFSTGDLQGLCGLVVDYDGATRRFYFDGIWPTAPSAGDKFVLLGKITTQA